MTEASARTDPLRIRFAEFELDEANALLRRGRTLLALPPTPFGLLCALARRPGALLTKHSLLDEVWGHRFVSDSVLKGAISEIRTILEDDPQHPRFIETVPRRGYRFIAAVTLVSAQPPTADGLGSIQYEQQHPERSTSSALSIKASVVPFVGRANELASLRRAWERVLDGKRAIVWIAGEPGIGKTTLIDRFTAGLGDIAYARGHCVQHYGSGEPYHPVLEALAELCRIDAAAPELLRAVAPTWLLQLPWLSTAAQREALLRELVGVSLERMLREMGEFLDRYTEHRPLLLVTEDLHWTDRSTIQLIDYLARRRTGGKLLWLSSFRLAEVVASDHPVNALRRELHLHGLCEEIVLDSFSEAEIAAYLAQRSPSLARDEDIVRALHERTEGVPLFVASVTSDVAARSAQSGVEIAALLENSPVPENLLAIIDHYIAKLGTDTRQLLSAAAVCGFEFRIETLASVLERDPLSVADECDQLAREQLWLVASQTPDHADFLERSYAFRHALFRQVVYDRMTQSVRVGLHRKVGAALEQERSGNVSIAATEVALHFDRGRAPLAALRYYGEAARAALLHVSSSECMNLTERALSLLGAAPAGEERTSLEITIATLRGVSTFHLLGAGDAALAAYERGSSLLANAQAHPMRGLLLHGLGFLHNLRGEYGEALVTADRAEALASVASDAFLALAACAVRGQAHMHLGQPQNARKSLERALPTIDRVDAAIEQSFIGFIVDPQVTIMATLSLPLTHLGAIREARMRLQQAYARAHELAQPMARLITIWFDALCEIRFDNVERVATLADEMHAVVQEFGLAQGKAACQWFRGWVNARQGESLEGFQLIRAAYEENRTLGMIAGSSETLGYAAEALLAHGDLSGAEEQLRQALEIVNTYGERIYLPQLLLTGAGIARASGRIDDAEASTRAALDEARAQGALWLELGALTELCAHATATSEERRMLGFLIERLREAHDTATLARARAVLMLQRSS